MSAATLAALDRLKTTGRKLILVTGRELPDLERVFPELAIFDRIVVENGALLYTPSSKEERALAPAPPTAFIQRLAARGVEPISVGRSIVATWEPHEESCWRRSAISAWNSDRLQQGRCHGAAERDQQVDRPCRGAGGTRTLAASTSWA